MGNLMGTKIVSYVSIWGWGRPAKTAAQGPGQQGLLFSMSDENPLSMGSFDESHGRVPTDGFAPIVWESNPEIYGDRRGQYGH
jgi:hypothetical protein